MYFSRNSGLLTAHKAVQTGGFSDVLYTSVCASAPLLHMILLWHPAPQTQEVAWASGPPAEHQAVECVSAV